VTPHTLPLQPATAPRRRVDRTCYCSIPYCATAAHGRRARGRVSLATTSCLGHSKQTSAARFNTPHKHASATQHQHQHTYRVNKAERSGCSTHSSQAREKCSCSQGHTPVQHGPEGEARGGSAPRGAITNSRDLWVTSKCCGKNGEHDTSSCKCPQNVLSERNWRNSSSSVCRCERRQRLRRFRGG